MADNDAPKPTQEDVQKYRRAQQEWIARCRAGEEIPRHAIVNYQLTDRFLFTPIDTNRDVHLAFAEAAEEADTHG
jgi:hypothetical protein